MGAPLLLFKLPIGGSNQPPVISAGDFGGTVPNLTKSVADNVSIGFTVGTLTADEAVTWSFQSGNTGTAFGITDGAITVLIDLDRYTVEDEYTLVVRATDAGLLYSEVTIVVTITDADARIIYDTFTGANGTLLTAHTPDENDPGGSWAAAIAAHASLEIQSNKASQAAAANNRANVIQCNDADVTIKVDFTGQANSIAGVIFRYVDDSNYWRIRFGNTNWAMDEIAAGVSTNRGTAAHGLGASPVTVAMEVRLNGTSIIFLANTVSMISITSAIHQAATKHGMLAAANGLSMITLFENFEVYP